MPELSRSQMVMYAAILAAVVFTGARALRSSPGDQGLSPPPSAASPDAFGTRSSAPATTASGGGGVLISRAAGGASVVQVAGAVRHPGVYRLPDGARVQDAVRRAGGRARGADVEAVNLAAKVADGQRIVVPKRSAAVAPAAGAAASVGPGPAAGDASQGGLVPDGPPVDLNTATVEQLDTLDGVGPATAQKIIRFREENGGFRSVDDLAQIAGIGAKRLAALKPRVVV